MAYTSGQAAGHKRGLDAGFDVILSTGASTTMTLTGSKIRGDLTDSEGAVTQIRGSGTMELTHVYGQLNFSIDATEYTSNDVPPTTIPGLSLVFTPTTGSNAAVSVKIDGEIVTPTYASSGDKHHITTKNRVIDYTVSVFEVEDPDTCVFPAFAVATPETSNDYCTYNIANENWDKTPVPTPVAGCDPDVFNLGWLTIQSMLGKSPYNYTNCDLGL
jgi:hypothetical protein